MTNHTPKVWIIAASDSAGASGIQADLATLRGLEVHGGVALTAVTAQNSQEVLSINPVATAVLRDQLRALRADGDAVAIKIGLLTDAEQVDVLREFLCAYSGLVVLDPVLGSSTGAGFGMSVAALKSLLPYVDVVTPNIPEAEQLADRRISSPADMLSAAVRLRELGAKGVWLKGGHLGLGEQCLDLVWLSEQPYWFAQPRLSVRHHRGTGCTLASALAAFVARGESLLDAAALANAYVKQGLRQGYAIGPGPGPIARQGWPSLMTDFPRITDRLDWLDYAAFPDCGASSLGLYPVVDSVEWLRKLLPLGIDTCQLRIKSNDLTLLEGAISEAAKLGRQYGCRLFINDHWRLAIKHGAYGVHLGQEDIADADLNAIRDAGLRLGVSTHGDFEWARAATIQPSYIAIGAIFPTQTKEVRIVGLEKLARWVALLQDHYPLTAIGGINLSNMDVILKTGVDSVAVVSAITQAPDLRDAVTNLSRKLLKGWE
ncbi:Thiamine monophosphate synthase [Hahella chejuensis KCTC 2396]|uniref:Thiamine-phosphate synthase n=1 Tax=Hahella chejuensis (strain KCTC 2396) TaxID=349521 RepID=Q2SQL4_HAHCH|nr:thiamine phosphate synthase [Hahella chejuensis]ABC27060.1 Thiamine monophosphate synthase [Hahella chejuensis KCTC 2396]